MFKFLNLILETPQDSSDTDQDGLKMNISKIRLSKKGTVLSGAMLVFFVASFLISGGIFNLRAESTAVEAALARDDFSYENGNVQKIQLLEAPLSLTFEKNAGVGGGSVAVVDESALASEMGPGGTEADVLVKESVAGPDEISIYVVREGDTLGEVAEMFSVSADTIVWANDLSSRKIQPGQELVILPVTGVRHAVGEKETLGGIVKKYKADLDEVMLYNGIEDEENLVVGDTLVIPNGEVPAPAQARSRASAPSSGGGGGSDWLIRPANGRRSQGIHGYNGIDIAAPVGTPVVAAASGQVIIARYGSWNGGYGNYAVIKHDNGTQTLYAHLNSLSVGQGQWVSQGQGIGTIGNTGRSTGPHLHFEVRGAGNPF